MKMVLNTLPARTWNRLGINESIVNIDEIFKSYTPTTEWTEKTAKWKAVASEDFGWSKVKTGVGSDITTLTEGAELSSVTTDKDVVMDKPIVLKYIYKDGENAISRLKIHAKENSTLSIVLLFQNETENDKGISVLQTHIVTEENAKVNISIVQMLAPGFKCFNDIGGVCEEFSGVELNKLELGSGDVYAGAYIDLKGEESFFETNIGYHVRSNEHLDMNYVAMHHGKNTQSLMEVNGILEEASHKAFRGTIDFQHGCRGAKGKETETVLLLGDELINQTTPLILCREEDVEGIHGATIGRLDEKVLFYLSSRGISEKEAQQIIAQSRIDAICEKIPDEETRSIVQTFEM